jgi:hypothetical protein
MRTWGDGLEAVQGRADPAGMSIVSARRGKAKNIYKPWTSVDQGYGRPSERPAQLRTQQECYVCMQLIRAGAMAAWSSRRRRWRHTGCSVGHAGSGGRA